MQIVVVDNAEQQVEDEFAEDLEDDEIDRLMLNAQEHDYEDEI